MLPRLLATLLAAATLNSPIALEIDRAQLARESRVAGYTVTETYKLRNSRFSEPAEMVVSVTFTRGVGKTYQVVLRKGPSFLQTGVLDKMLKEEGEMSRGEVREGALVTSANYSMQPAGDDVRDGRRCDKLELTPLRKSPHLLKGTAWVDSRSHNLIHIEGKPAASISFWVGTPQVVREYVEIGDFSFAHRSHVVTQGFILGRSELSVDYTDYHVGLQDASPKK